MRPQRNCLQPHGTIARYTAGCSCFPCRVAWTDYQVGRSHNPLKVDPAPARKHIAALKRAGVEYQVIAARAGLAVSTLSWVRKRSALIRRETADAIIGVAMPGGQKHVDRERFVMLKGEGLPTEVIADILGCSTRQVDRLEASA